jgi:hypothetical protein
MWWSIPVSIILVVILVAIPMILDYSAERRENKNDGDKDDIDN